MSEQQAPVAVVTAHAWEVIERWLRDHRARRLGHVDGLWIAAERRWWVLPRRVASAATIPELAGKLRGEVDP